MPPGGVGACSCTFFACLVTGQEQHAQLLELSGVLFTRALLLACAGETASRRDDQGVLNNFQGGGYFPSWRGHYKNAMPRNLMPPPRMRRPTQWWSKPENTTVAGEHDDDLGHVAAHADVAVPRVRPAIDRIPGKLLVLFAADAVRKAPRSKHGHARQQLTLAHHLCRIRAALEVAPAGSKAVTGNSIQSTTARTKSIPQPDSFPSPEVASTQTSTGTCASPIRQRLCIAGVAVWTSHPCASTRMPQT